MRVDDLALSAQRSDRFLLGMRDLMALVYADEISPTVAITGTPPLTLTAVVTATSHADGHQRRHADRRRSLRRRQSPPRRRSRRTPRDHQHASDHHPHCDGDRTGYRCPPQRQRPPARPCRAEARAASKVRSISTATAMAGAIRDGSGPGQRTSDAVRPEPGGVGPDRDRCTRELQLW